MADKKIMVLAVCFLIIGFALLEAQPGVNTDSLKKHVAFLSSDALEGRGTGTAGGAKAAQYLARQLEKYGLEPIADRGTYFQTIPMHGAIPKKTSALRLHQAADDYAFELNRDYLLYKSGAQTYVPQPVELIFAGYGISAPEYDYNDYQNLEVEGKVVVFLAGEPPSESADYFDGPYPTIHSYPESKQRVALARGARGSILIPNPREEGRPNWREWVNKFAFEDVTLAYAATANLSVVMNPAAANRLFQKSVFSLKDVYRMDARHRMQSFPLNCRLSFRGEFEQRDFWAANVVGMIPGDGEDYILLSAHYDHLGIGRPVKNDSIYNGCFDNAAGVAALLEIARNIAALPAKPRHSIVFLFTTGEEKGLLGASYYADFPIRPLYRTWANLNVDGLAMFDTFDDIMVVGGSFSNLGELVTQVAGAFNLRVSPIPPGFSANESFARSDQMAFAKAGIPAILIAEGLNYRHYTSEQAFQQIIDWNTNIYHTPFDDLSQPMNWDAAAQHCRLLYHLTLALANLDQKPEWKPGTTYINARLRSEVEKR